MSVQALIIKAVNIREKGDPKGALEIFTEVVKNLDNPISQAGVMGDMALCHQHLGNFDTAALI